MNPGSTNWKTFVYNLGVYLLLGAVAVRMIPFYYDTPYRLLVIILLAVHFGVEITGWLLSRRHPGLAYPYIAIQTGLIVTLLLVCDPPHDYFALLFIPLSFQVGFLLPGRRAYVCIAIMAVCATIALLIRFPVDEAAAYALTYAFVMFFVPMLGLARIRAEEANARAQSLLADLQVAHRQLQESAAQMEVLAAAQERNRLARELHDSVTQTIFSMTLTAQSARLLAERDPERLPAQLDHLQTLAQNALTEMRSLIQQLHPRTLAEEGLAAALRRHAAERLAQEGLSVDVQITGARRLPSAVEEMLFRVAQEALNNVVKHSGADRAVLSLCLEPDCPVTLMVRDEGAGFDLASVTPGRLGLTGMAERARALGAVLNIQSRPGAGACVTVEYLSPEEKVHA